MNLKVKAPSTLASPLRRTLYTAPKFFDAHHASSSSSTTSSLPAIPTAPRNGRGKPEFVMSATMSLQPPQMAPGEGRGGVVRGWDAQRDGMVRRGRRMELDVGGYGISKSGAVGTGRGTVQVGEDAYFVGRRGMGVADGVGGWKKHGSGSTTPGAASGSAVFAERLMRYAAEECEDMEPPRPSNFIGMLERRWDVYEEMQELEDAIDVLLVLENAYARSITAKPPPPTEGSSTALVAVLSPSTSNTTFTPTCTYIPFHPPPFPTPSACSTTFSPLPSPLTTTLKIAHVGDCMAMLIRGPHLVFRSSEMWWAFNTPVQLSPHASPADVNPHTFTLPVQQGDLVILATDGLSDNLWDEDILDEVSKWRHSLSDDVNILSEALCSRARTIARDPKAVTPFATRAREEGKSFTGGKKDDVSVVCAIVQQR